MGRRKHYSIEKKAEVLALLEAEDGNKSAVCRQTGVSRKTILEWERDRSQIMADHRAAKKYTEETGVSKEKAESAIENSKIGESYDIVKRNMADNFSKITTKAQQIAWDKMESLDAKDAMWVASVGIDKLMKLKGEPDQVVEVRNVVVHEVIGKLLEAVEDGIIEKSQAEVLADKFDEIEEAEYEEV